MIQRDYDELELRLRSLGSALRRGGEPSPYERERMIRSVMSGLDAPVREQPRIAPFKIILAPSLVVAFGLVLTFALISSSSNRRAGAPKRSPAEPIGLESADDEVASGFTLISGTSLESNMPEAPGFDDQSLAFPEQDDLQFEYGGELL